MFGNFIIEYNGYGPIEYNTVWPMPYGDRTMDSQTGFNLSSYTELYHYNVVDTQCIPRKRKT